MNIDSCKVLYGYHLNDFLNSFVTVIIILHYFTYTPVLIFYWSIVYNCWYGTMSVAILYIIIWTLFLIYFIITLRSDTTWLKQRGSTNPGRNRWLRWLKPITKTIGVRLKREMIIISRRCHLKNRSIGWWQYGRMSIYGCAWCGSW